MWEKNKFVGVVNNKQIFMWVTKQMKLYSMDLSFFKNSISQ